MFDDKSTVLSLIGQILSIPYILSELENFSNKYPTIEKYSLSFFCSLQLYSKKELNGTTCVES